MLIYFKERSQLLLHDLKLMFSLDIKTPNHIIQSHQNSPLIEYITIILKLNYIKL